MFSIVGIRGLYTFGAGKHPFIQGNRLFHNCVICFSRAQTRAMETAASAASGAADAAPRSRGSSLAARQQAGYMNPNCASLLAPIYPAANQAANALSDDRPTRLSDYLRICYPHLTAKAGHYCAGTTAETQLVKIKEGVKDPQIGDDPMDGNNAGGGGPNPPDDDGDPSDPEGPDFGPESEYFAAAESADACIVVHYLYRRAGYSPAVATTGTFCQRSLCPTR